MNRKTGLVVAFVSGAVIGSVMAWRLMKKRNSTLEEEAFSEKSIEEDIPEEFAEQEERTAFKETIEECAYTHKKGEEADTLKSHPYVISPDEFGENDTYDQISLTLYSDGILTDDDNNIVEDVDDTVGIESLNHFGEYEADSVFVRNDLRKADFEILLDTRAFTDVYQQRSRIK